jgi:hypothetical protein
LHDRSLCRHRVYLRDHLPPLNSAPPETFHSGSPKLHQHATRLRFPDQAWPSPTGFRQHNPECPSRFSPMVSHRRFCAAWHYMAP